MADEPPKDTAAPTADASSSSLSSHLATAKSLLSRGTDALVHRAHDTFSHGAGIVDNLTSYLGADNPFAHAVENEEQLVWLFDSAAYRASVAPPDLGSVDPETQPKDSSTQAVAAATGAEVQAETGEKDLNKDNAVAHTTSRPDPPSATKQEAGEETWCTNLVAAFFARRSGRDVAEFVSELCKDLGIAEDSEEQQRVTRRVTPLFNTILPAHTARIRVGNEGDPDSTVITLPPSDRSGISSAQLLPLAPTHVPGDTLPVTVQAPSTNLNATIRFAQPQGWAVISDIDDTIKKTLTDQARGILRTTFLDEAEHIPGMPELYASISKKFATVESVPGAGAADDNHDAPPFWYLSASPYNLYPFLRHFLETHNFPLGSMYLKEASWMNITGFLASLAQNTQAYKVARMDAIHAAFPHRKFICFGDSTQSDPEAYAETYKKYPGWIKGIFIRRVVGVKEIGDGVVPGISNEERIKSERFDKAFEGVPKDVWMVFESPAEIEGRLEDVRTRG